MKTTYLLETDKEKLTSSLLAADSMDKAVQIMEQELNRLLLRYQEDSEPSDGADALFSFDVVKSALPLAEGSGEIRVYPRSMPSEPDPEIRKSRTFLLSGIALEAVGALLLIVFSRTALSVILTLPALAALIAGGVFLYLSGSGRTGFRKKNEQYYTEVRPDAERLYRHLMNILTVIDRNLEERKTAVPDPGTSSSLRSGSLSDLPEEDITFFSSLLEQVYAVRAEEPENQWVKEMISGIRYYLHRHSVEIADYDEAGASWFDRIPAATTETLRPALLLRGQTGNVLLKRGLASEKN